jgi:hypothetical protein
MVEVGSGGFVKRRGGHAVHGGFSGPVIWSFNLRWRDAAWQVQCEELLNWQNSTVKKLLSEPGQGAALHQNYMTI